MMFYFHAIIMGFMLLEILCLVKLIRSQIILESSTYMDKS